MFSRRQLSLRRAALSVAIAPLLLASAFAQSGQTASTPANRVLRTDAFDASLAASASAYAKGHFEEAEAQLLAVNAAKRETALWHLESARRLYHMAFYFQTHQGKTIAARIASRAFGMLDLAVAKARATRSAKDEVRALQLSAVLEENLNGNFDAALRLHQQALQLDPRSRVSTEEAQRLSQAAQALVRQMARN
jgi:hypothetical protein